MAKLTLNTVLSGYYSTAALNDNFDAIVTAIQNTLSRDGSGPNYMDDNLDMNSNDILNVGKLEATGLVVAGVDLQIATLLFPYATAIQSVYNSIASVVTVANNIASVNTTATNIASVNTVASNISSILAVINNLSALQSFAANYSTFQTYYDGAVAAANTATIAKDSVISALNTANADMAYVTALLGAGIGSTYIDGDGNLWITYADAALTGIFIDSNGFLNITYV